MCVLIYGMYDVSVTHR